jgi:hypothetical protein
MKVDVTQNIKNLNDTFVIDVMTKEPVTLRDVLITSVTMDVKNQPKSGPDKLKCYQFGIKLQESDTVELTTDDIVFLKQEVAKVQGTLIYGRVCDILEGRLSPVYADVPATSETPEYKPITLGESKDPEDSSVDPSEGEE